MISPITGESGPIRQSAGATPLHIEIDHRNDVVYITLDGDVSFDALSDAHEAIFAHGALSATTSVFIDCRVVTSIPTPTRMRELAIRWVLERERAPRGRVAMVAMTRLGLEYAQLWSQFVGDDSDRIRVFTSRLEARHWLGLADD